MAELTAHPSPAAHRAREGKGEEERAMAYFDPIACGAEPEDPRGHDTCHKCGEEADGVYLHDGEFECYGCCEDEGRAIYERAEREDEDDLLNL